MNSLDKGYVMRRALESPPPIAENIRMFYDMATKVDTNYCLVLPEDVLCPDKWPSLDNRLYAVDYMVGLRPMRFIKGPIASYSSAGEQVCSDAPTVREVERDILWAYYGHKAIGWSLVTEFAGRSPMHVASVVWGVTRSSMHEIDPTYVFTCEQAAIRAYQLLNS